MSAIGISKSTKILDFIGDFSPRLLDLDALFLTVDEDDWPRLNWLAKLDWNYWDLFASKSLFSLVKVNLEPIVAKVALDAMLYLGNL